MLYISGKDNTLQCYEPRSIYSYLYQTTDFKVPVLAVSVSCVISPVLVQLGNNVILMWSAIRVEESTDQCSKPGRYDTT